MNIRTNEDWLRALRGAGPEQALALADLRALLQRGALYSFRRTQYDLSRLGHAEIVQLAEDSAQEALLAVLAHMNDFRGESKFTTWAYKFAINVALSCARRESWKHVSLDQMLEDSGLPDLPFADPHDTDDPHRSAWRREVWNTVREVIEQELTERQRQVLRLMVFEEAPMDEVASYFRTNRNAIYKLLHDARRKLKTRLAARGLALDEVMDLSSGA